MQARRILILVRLRNLLKQVMSNPRTRRLEATARAGFAIKSEPEDMFWGDRVAAVVDPFGHSWMVRVV